MQKAGRNMHRRYRHYNVFGSRYRHYNVLELPQNIVGEL
jgi:hypothetical protein